MLFVCVCVCTAFGRMCVWLIWLCWFSLTHAHKLNHTHTGTALRPRQAARRPAGDSAWLLVIARENIFSNRKPQFKYQYREKGQRRPVTYITYYFMRVFRIYIYRVAWRRKRDGSVWLALDWCACTRRASAHRTKRGWASETTFGCVFFFHQHTLKQQVIHAENNALSGGVSSPSASLLLLEYIFGTPLICPAALGFPVACRSSRIWFDFTYIGYSARAPVSHGEGDTVLAISSIYWIYSIYQCENNLNTHSLLIFVSYLFVKRIFWQYWHIKIYKCEWWQYISYLSSVINDI